MMARPKIRATPWAASEPCKGGPSRTTRPGGRSSVSSSVLRMTIAPRLCPTKCNSRAPSDRAKSNSPPAWSLIPRGSEGKEKKTGGKPAAAKRRLSTCSCQPDIHKPCTNTTNEGRSELEVSFKRSAQSPTIALTSEGGYGRSVRRKHAIRRASEYDGSSGGLVQNAQAILAMRSRRRGDGLCIRMLHRVFSLG